jgi:Fe-S oxidoreductase
MALENVNEWLWGCTHCGTCKDVLKIFVPACPAGEKYQLESYFPSGRMFIARGVSQGILSLDDEELRERIYACTGCLSCEQQCGVYHHQHIFETVQALRTEAVTQGLLNPGYMSVYYGLRGEDNVFGKPRAERGDWARGLPVKLATQHKVSTLFHAGCMLSFDPELWSIPRSMIELMQAAGEDVGIMGKEENCCGGRAYEIGYLGEFTKYAEHTIQTCNSLGITSVVTSCSDGYSFFKNLYPKVNVPMNFEVLHSVEYMDKAIASGKLKLSHPVPLRVTYHDPCHLGRHLGVGIYDAPRSVLKSIPGIEFVEMERMRENAWCCGAGAGASHANPDFALWTANERLKEAEATGATALVTSCPWCERNFRDAAHKYNGKLEILDIAELVRKAVNF